MTDEIAIPDYLQRDWDRARRWGQLCDEGHCGYEGLAASEPAPRFSPAERCPGYVSVLRLEGREYVLRTKLCPRQLAWHGRRRLWLRAQRAKEKQQHTEPPAGWRRETEN